jgi:putative RecB family exonuclease
VRKPTFSPTKLTTYLACPLKYRWTYVDARGKWHLRAKSYYSFGLTLHRVLERFHSEQQPMLEPKEALLSAYEESWLDAGFSSADEMADAYGEGKAILEQYAEEYAAAARGANTLFVEKNLRWDMGEFILCGRADRIDEHPDGSLEIIDYKSGRRATTTEDVASDLAMSCYQLLLKNLYPDRRIFATILSLQTGQTASYGMSEEELADFEADLRELCHRIGCHDFFEMAPIYRSLCPNCDFLSLCRQHPEFCV